MRVTREIAKRVHSGCFDKSLGIKRKETPVPETDNANKAYLATMNVPGYVPMNDNPPTFNSAKDAWAYHLSEREEAEDQFPLDKDGVESGEYSDDVATLRAIVKALSAESGGLMREHGIDDDGTGTVYAARPGYEGDHDLGLAYSVSLVDLP